MTERNAGRIKPPVGSDLATPSRHMRGARLRRALPLATLGLSLSCVFWFGGATGYLYGNHIHAYNTAKWMAMAQNLEFATGLQFPHLYRDAGGSIRYEMFNRFPIGGTALVKLATSPFEGDLSAQLVAARTLMLAFFCGSALLAYAALFRIVGSRPIALAATLLAFSSYYMLIYNDIVNSEVGMDVFALLLVFHAMVLFRDRATARGLLGMEFPKRRFAWLLATVGVALLLGWHVFALLAAFVMLGLAGEARAVWRQSAPTASPRRSLPRLGAVALAMLRSRITLLAICSVLIGATVFGCNLAVEHAHMVGPKQERGTGDVDTGTALALPAWHAHSPWRTTAKLPTPGAGLASSPAWHAVLRRTGLDGGLKGFLRPVGWDPFLKWQFHRVGVMVLPVAAAGIGRLPLADEVDWKYAETPPLTGLGMAATALCFAGLCLRGRRPRGGVPGRGLLAVLALSGFCWTIPMHRNTVWMTHDFEACMYIGLALVSFTLLGVGVRQIWRATAGAAAPGVPAVAGAALAALVFAASSYRMAQEAARRTDAAQPAVLAEFETIRELARGKDVLVAATRSELGSAQPAFGGVAAAMLAPYSISWYLAGAVLHYAPNLTETARVEADGGIDFVLTFERVNAPVHTPTHRFAFLYDAGGVAKAIADARRRSHDAIAAREPLARGDLEVHLLPVSPHLRASATRGARGGDLALAYFKHGCRPEDLHGVFFLEVTPANVADLPPLLRRAGRQMFYFKPHEFFELYEDKCQFRKPLPPYPVRSIRTGRLIWDDRPGWEARARIDLHTLRRARDAVNGAAPAGRGPFDVHLRDRTLTYVRTPCAGADTLDRFFLHVTPARRGALPPHRRPIGFSNLDFDFNEHGARFNGECVATLALPAYEIDRVATGQFASNGAVRWQVTFGAGTQGTRNALRRGSGSAQWHRSDGERRARTP